MPRELTAEDAVRMAQYIVESWEGIPARVDAFCTQFGEQYRETVERMCREAAGGEEVYLASKAFLEGR